MSKRNLILDGCHNEDGVSAFTSIFENQAAPAIAFVCLSKEKDYSKASLIQKKFDSYAEARSKLDEILEDNSINTREVESSLSPDKPVEFLILHAFDYARKNGVISGILNGAIDKIVFNEDSDVFVRKVLEVLGGERSYTLRITHSKEGKVYSSVELN